MKNLFSLILLFVSLSLFAQSTDSSTYFFQKGIEEKTTRKYLLSSNYFEKAIKLDPNFTNAYVENAFVNLEMRRTDAAMKNFTKVLELEPTNQLAIKELVHLNFNYRQYQKAIDFAQKCTSCDDKERIIAMSYFQMEDYAKAEKILVGLIAKNPKDAEATYTAAKNYLEMGLEQKAIPIYVKAVELDPTQSKWSFELGLIYYNNNNHKNAVVYFNKAADNGYYRSNDFNENLGFSYIYSGEFEKGETLLLEIIARKPGDKEVLRDIAEAYYQRKLYDKSLEFCQKLMEMDMQDGKALYQAGLCFQKKGETQRGQQMCDKAIELDPSLSKLRSKSMMAGL